VEECRVRVVSLLPAATEIVAALGQTDRLVGVSHECDFPDEVNAKPRVTRCAIHDAGLPSAEIDGWVRETLAETGTLYTMDEPLLRRLAPDVILTQRLCDVCAVGYGTVAALAATLPGPPQVVNLEPSSLAEIFGDIRRVAEALGVPKRGAAVVAQLEARVEAVRSRAARTGRRPRCFLMEWIDPPFCSGHWGPELVEIAGGEDPLGRKGLDSSRIPWEDVLAAQPEVIVLACCGYRAERTLEDLPILQGYPGWAELPAVRNGQVYAVDGSAYFSRPGPRVVDSLEILAEILHPGRWHLALGAWRLARPDGRPSGQPCGVASSQAPSAKRQAPERSDMRIYTKTGDTGETGLFGGGRVSKADLRVEAYGSVDELNAQLGWAETLLRHLPLPDELRAIQSDLFVLGADLATPADPAPAAAARARRVEPAQIERLEAWIDQYDAETAPLTHFILPGGAPGAAALHVCRGVCRRAERAVVRLAQADPVNPSALVYLNRLSDLLFVLARWVNAREGVAEPIWE
jgi:iron complex transport system substrate-binding protein